MTTTDLAMPDHELQRRAFLGVVAAAAATLGGCANMRSDQKRTFILVHGAWHGGWCWERVAAGLTAKGHRVDAIDLPGHGKQVGVPPDEVTLSAYSKGVTAAIDRAGSPVVLVGHSMGGVAITGAAEERPERVIAAVYLAAFLLPSGRSLRDYTSLPENAGNLLTSTLGISVDKKFLTFDKSMAHEIFYADCPERDVQNASKMIGPQPLKPIAERGVWTEERFGRVRKVYIKTLRDRAVAPDLQSRMIRDTRVDKVETLDSSHSPFFSMPEKLQEILIRS